MSLEVVELEQELRDLENQLNGIKDLIADKKSETKTSYSPPKDFSS